MESSGFVHLHTHSEYSLVDGLLRIDELVQTASKMGCMAVALTDQSNLFGLIKFYQAAEAAGIKPIMGAEVWVSDEGSATPHRLILLCQNTIGYKHLTALISRSYTEAQDHTKPYLRKAWLEQCHEGLIAIAPARESDIALAILSENQPLAERLTKNWQRLFSDRFYLEITRTGCIEDARYSALAVQLSKVQNLPLVATNNVRFLNRDDFEAHEARVCIHEARFLNDAQKNKVTVEEQYLKSPEAMAALFADLPEALENSVEIAKRCNLVLDLGKTHLPHYPIQPGTTIEAVFQEAAQRGLVERFKGNVIPEAHQTRLETEISVLNKMGYAGYFLIVADFIHWAKTHKIPVGPGRGSGAGSLVAYALGITGLDPLAYDLLFERFLNPERVSMPDFDIDFCIDGRDRVIDYVTQTYGRESVSQIITYGTMAAKAVIRDVGRVLGYPYGFVDKIAKLIPLILGITLEKALVEEPLLKQRYQDEEDVKRLIDLAKKLEGIVRNAGKHAGGVVIAPSKLTDFTPLYCDAEGHVLSQFDKDDIETIGLVKFDFLGLRTLTVIDHAIQEVNRLRDLLSEPILDITQIHLKDEKVFDLLRACNTTAIFQLESRGMKDLVKRLQPDNFEEIIALVALFRPGPLQSGMVEDFINRKHGRATPEYLHPRLVHILKPTYGVILYQEQVMQIAQVLAGYTLGAADLLRRAMGKKKPEEMAKQRAFFVGGAVERGVESLTATHIFDLMEKFAGYGFNKSHSAAYALITYQTAWLKTHYPQAFMAAVLSSEMSQTDKLVLLIDDCRASKIPIVPPDINHSQYRFYADPQGQIVYGLGAIKGVGEAAVQSIVEARSAGPFKHLQDFCSRVDPRKVNLRLLEILIRAGALDSLGRERAYSMAILPEVQKRVEQLAKRRMQGQGDLFGSFGLEESLSTLPAIESIKPWSESERLEGEKQTLGLYLSGHPLAQYQDRLASLRSSTLDRLSPSQGTQSIAGLITAIRTLLTRKGDKMAFVTLDDGTARQDVVLFSDCYQAHRDLLVKDNRILMRVDVSIDNYSGGYRVRCLEIKSFDQAVMQAAKNLSIVLRMDAQGLIQPLQTLLSVHKHEEGCPVMLDYQTEGRSARLKLGETWRVNPTQPLIDALKAMEGVETVELAF